MKLVAIVGSVLENHEVKNNSNSVVAKGLTWFALKKIKCYFRSALLARIITTLADVLRSNFGNPEVTTGASNDLQVTNIARQMVTRYGMSNIGPIALKVIMSKCI
jgi:cell division protease FtsH